MTFCSGICKTHPKRRKRNALNPVLYKDGLIVKYCTFCEVWYEMTELRCPCCDQGVRNSKRSSKHKMNLKRI